MYQSACIIFIIAVLCACTLTSKQAHIKTENVALENPVTTALQKKDSLPPQNNHLRARILLIDSTYVPCGKDNYGHVQLFQVKNLFYGSYKYDSIYVCCDRRDLYQFCKHMDSEPIYWWCLAKTADSIHHFPLYQHSGNF